jgi:hypothetical protein
MRTIALALAVFASLALAGCGRDPGPKGDPGPQGASRPARCARHSGGARASVGKQDHRARKVRQARRVTRATPERLFEWSRAPTQSPATPRKHWFLFSARAAAQPMGPNVQLAPRSDFV